MINLKYSISKLFGKGSNYSDKDWDHCSSVLVTSLLQHKTSDIRYIEVNNELLNWNKLTVTEKSKEFPRLFLLIRTYLRRYSKIPNLFDEDFNHKISTSLGKHLQLENIFLLFKEKDIQQILLSKFFLIQILNNAKEILGSTGNNMLNRGISFCNSFPNYDKIHIEGLSMLETDSTDTLTILKDFSHQLSKKLSLSFGETRISGFYKTSHKYIRDQYGLLESFPFLLDLIPEQYLRFEDINTLDNAYLRDALKKTVDQLTERNSEIEKKNKELGKTEAKLQKLANRLQVINEIDRTILKSDSLDEFIYGTLDVLQTRMQLKNTSLVFFDFEKQFYSEHLLQDGVQKVQRKVMNNFQGNLDKLRQSEPVINNQDNSSKDGTLYFPIIEQGELIASITFEKEETSDFSEEFIDTVKELSGGMAISIVNRKLEEELQKRNKDMTDSLYYAQRIQNALIPSFQNFTTLFEDNFVIFKPKDVVSGDFYWAHETFDNRKIWITADCTGHGVPGAIMSVIGFNILNKVVIEKGIWEPNKILDELRENIISTLTQKGDKHQTKDGMDVSVCVYNPNRGTLQYSGALNSIFIVRGSKSAEDFEGIPKVKIHPEGIIELQPDKMPAAFFEGTTTPFSKITVLLEEGDSVYTFSDGFSDQFGGINDKKFMVKNFRKLLASVSHLKMNEQKLLIEDAFINWKGDKEQIDDVCLIGIKITEDLAI